MIALLDIGGTQIKYGVFDGKKNELIDLGATDTGPFVEDFSMVEKVKAIVAEIAVEYPVEGLGISTAGTVDHQTGEIIYANPNIPNYKGTQLKRELEAILKIPCWVENDVNSALLGELHFGKLESVEHAIMFTIGTGVGGAVYLNGELYHGASMSAGEVGYSTLNGANIEDVISARALVEKAQRIFADPTIDGYWLFENAKAGNEKCQEIIDHFLEQLSQFMMNSVSLMNPEVVILGGGIMQQVDYLEKRLVKKFDTYSNKFVLEQTQIKFATLGNRAGMYGAYSHYQTMEGKRIVL